MERFFAIVNPAAGGGRSAKLAGSALARLRERGLHADVIASTGPGHAEQLAREAYDQGYRRFLAVGGDGTAHEILNGVFANRRETKRIALGFLPLGTGNSFLRDFTNQVAQASLDGLILAGDAAGFIDPMTGDGLRFAIRGAELAAAAALDALVHGWSGVHPRLARARRAEFRGKQRFNRALRSIVASPSAIDAAAVAARVLPVLMRGIIARAGDCLGARR